MIIKWSINIYLKIVFYLFAINLTSTLGLSQNRILSAKEWQNTKEFQSNINEEGEFMEPLDEGWGYPFDSLLADINIWRKNQLITIDTFGFTLQNRPLIRLTIHTNLKSKIHYRRVAIHARTHPAEVQSSYIIKEIINALTTGTEIGNKLLDSCVFSIVPLYNVDGVELGLPRTNADYVDIEGGWELATPEPETQALRSMYNDLMGTEYPIEVALNLHSAIACKRYFVFHHANGTSEKYTEQEKKFINAVKGAFPTGIENWDYSITWTTGTPIVYPESWFWLNFHESVLALTYEDMNCPSAGDYNITANALLRGIAVYLNIEKDTANNNTEITSINDKTDFFVFPNPVHPEGSFTLYNDFAKNGNVKISFYNMQGQLVHSEIFKPTENSITLPALKLGKGMFLIYFEDETTQQIKKLIIE